MIDLKTICEKEWDIITKVEEIPTLTDKGKDTNLRWNLKEYQKEDGIKIIPVKQETANYFRLTTSKVKTSLYLGENLNWEISFPGSITLSCSELIQIVKEHQENKKKKKWEELRVKHRIGE